MRDKGPLSVLAISGSLRQRAFNTALLRAAQELAPEGMSIDLYDGLASIPPYDDDVRLTGYPLVVEDLREQIRHADALILATPEYNRSFSGVLKNAIDWASRPPDQPFDGKLAIVMGAGPGLLGTALANYQLRQVLSVMNVHVVPGRELLVAHAADKFDSSGTLNHEPTRDAIRESLLELCRMILLFKGMQTDGSDGRTPVDRDQ